MPHLGMGKPSDHPGFKAIYTEWNQKLLDSGFNDIEEMRNGKLTLKKTGTQGRFEQMAPLVRQAKARYFDIIGQKIVETTFDNDQEKRILTLYFEGFSYSDIIKRLNTPLHRSTVWKILYKWLRQWNLK